MTFNFWIKVAKKYKMKLVLERPVKTKADKPHLIDPSGTAALHKTVASKCILLILGLSDRGHKLLNFDLIFV